MNATETPEKTGPVFLQGGINDISMETRGELLDRLVSLERRALLAERKLKVAVEALRELDDGASSSDIRLHCDDALAAIEQIGKGAHE